MANTKEFNEAFSQERLDGLTKSREEWNRRESVGRRFSVPREGAEDVNVILYEPKNRPQGKPLPVFFNMHGGGWTDGDAILLDSFCSLLADEIPAFVVNVNYTKGDVRQFPYPAHEVRDTVKFFAARAGEYGIDANRMAVGGHSAGAHLAASAALMLKDEGIRLACQALVYPVLDMVLNKERKGPFISWFMPNGEEKTAYGSPLLASDEELQGVCPAVIVLCGKDHLRPQGIGYAKRLMDLATSVGVKEYPEAVHGFLEVNRPDYAPDDPRRSPEQAMFARDAEQYLIYQLRAYFRV